MSEPLKPCADSGVISWLDNQAKDTLYLTSTSLAELLLGIELMPDGKRKSNFRSDVMHYVERLFGDRILSFDQAAAIAYAAMISCTRQRGKTVELADGQIAAIAEVNDFAIATSDTASFLAAGLRVINPLKN